MDLSIEKKFSILMAVIGYKHDLEKIDVLKKQLTEKKVAFWSFLVLGIIGIFLSRTDEGFGFGAIILFAASIFWVKKGEVAGELKNVRGGFFIYRLHEIARLKIVFTDHIDAKGVCFCDGEVETTFSEEWDGWTIKCEGRAIPINIWDEKFYAE